jgi:hypothetical protein
MFDSDSEVTWQDLSIASKLILCDPQVNGGLLLSAPKILAESQLVPRIRASGSDAWIIGNLTERRIDSKKVVVQRSANTGVSSSRAVDPASLLG